MFGNDVLFAPTLRYPELAYIPEPSSSIRIPHNLAHVESNHVKPTYPYLFFSWETALNEVRQIVYYDDASEARAFRLVLLRSFILYILWPFFLLAVFIALLVFYPSYILWFAWVGFLIFLFIIYRFKQLFEALYFLNNSSSSSNSYTENRDAEEVSVAPPSYSQARSRPPSYHVAMSQI